MVPVNNVTIFTETDVLNSKTHEMVTVLKAVYDATANSTCLFFD